MTAAPDHVPQPLVDRLKVGGWIVIPVGDACQEQMLCVNTQHALLRKGIIPVRFVPLPGEEVRKKRR